MVVRYDTRDGDGITRRDRNERFGQGHLNREADIPLEGWRLWEWYWQLSNVRISHEQPINYVDLAAWSQMTGSSIGRPEQQILFAMDARFRSEIASEIKSNISRAEARRGNNKKGS